MPWDWYRLALKNELSRAASCNKEPKQESKNKILISPAPQEGQ